ncbi:MAG: SH3 domain-containing protein [Nitrospinae bacterium]|nr:SH3 domain-containing protein [Nitrospinota bacterium]
MSTNDFAERRTRKSRSSLDKDRAGAGYCVACKTRLPPHALFCPRCGPPLLPDAEPEEGLTFAQAFLRIIAIALLFLLLVIYKYDLKFADYFPQIASRILSEPEPEVATDADLQVVYEVNSLRANVRDKGSMGGKVLFNVKRGDTVAVLGTEDNWSRIKMKDGRTGWIYSALLTAKVE